MIRRSSEPTPDRPLRLFKYLPPERIDFLSTWQLRFTPPAAFNDPFDVAPVASFGSDPAELEATGGGQSIARRLREVLQRHADVVFNRPEMPQRLVSETHGILSLSDRCDSLLMWAHYASNHRGLAIEFRASHEWLAGAQRVAYSDRRPFVSPLAPKTAAEDRPAGPGYFFQKSVDWAYEREWRLVRKLDEADRVLTIENAAVHLFSVPVSAVTGVIIGARMPVERRTKLAALLLARPQLRVRALQARLSPRKFALEFTPLSRRDLRALCGTAEPATASAARVRGARRGSAR